MKTKNNRPARPSVVRVPLDASDLEQFTALCADDGITPAKAIGVLVRWSIAQGSLCPVHKASDMLAQDLHVIHRMLTKALKTVKVDAGHFSDEGEEWKEGGK